MKRFAAIFLLAVLLYNAFGYYVLYAYGQEKARSISPEEIPESAYQVVKVQLALYSTIANSDFEYVNCEFNYGGKTFHVFKKRIENDSLCLYFIRNVKQEELRSNFNNVVETQTLGKSSGTNAPTKQLLKSYLKEYIPTVAAEAVRGSTADNSAHHLIHPRPESPVQAPYLSVISPPPEAA